uniref:Uncharacterized protein n=1 Tax=Paramormyrops kingsleyae TaxID=1676925 RepID=A0A3B3QX23_9TELE
MSRPGRRRQTKAALVALAHAWQRSHFSGVQLGLRPDTKQSAHSPLTRGRFRKSAGPLGSPQPAHQPGKAPAPDGDSAEKDSLLNEYVYKAPPGGSSAAVANLIRKGPVYMQVFGITCRSAVQTQGGKHTAANRSAAPVPNSSRVRGLNPAPLSVHGGALGLNPTPVSVRGGPLGLNSTPVSVRGGALGFNPAPVSVRGGALGFNPAPLCVRGGALSFNPAPVSVRGGALGLNPSPVSVRGGALGLNPAPLSARGVRVGLNPAPLSARGGPLGLNPAPLSARGGPLGLNPAPLSACVEISGLSPAPHTPSWSPTLAGTATPTRISN